MKNKRLYLLVGFFMLLFIVGCAKTLSANYESYNFEVNEQTSHSKNLTETESEILVENLIETESEVLVEYSIQNEVLPKVIGDDYSKAYAQALFEGTKVPSEEADNLMKNNESLIENEPRLVIDSNQKMHIIWTNDKMFLVIDGKETQLKVSECIYVDELPRLPEELEELEKYHKSNQQVRFGIAENAFLEELYFQLKESGIDASNGLYRVRFYNYNGAATAVYSLSENGELYINKNVAQEILQ